MSTTNYPTEGFDSSIRFTKWAAEKEEQLPAGFGPGDLVIPPNPERGPYELRGVIGKGGFGHVLECVAPDDPERVLAIKVTAHHEAWARELHFNSIIGHSPHVIRLIDTFALPAPASRSGVVFCTVMERASSDLRFFLRTASRPLSETRIIRITTSLLTPLSAMHLAGAVHRDVTPKNVFVMANGAMKLADFGIAAQAIGTGRVRATAWNPSWAPAGLGRTDPWTPSIDCWQVGQLMAAMVSRNVDGPIKQTEVRRLDCSDAVKEIIWRAVSLNGPERFGNASEFLEALKSRALVRDLIPTARPSSLKQRSIVFTGKLPGMEREEASRRAQRKGARVGTSVTYDTDYIVVGGQTAAWAAGSSGTKLLTAHRLNTSGANIKQMSETTFLRLIGRGQ